MNRMVVLLLCAWFPLFLLAQEKADRVFFTNGDAFTGKVVAIQGDSISFVHKGESLVYRFARKQVVRIEFASGRVEVMSAGQHPEVQENTPASKNPNLVAVLPFHISQSSGYDPESPFLIQQEFFRQASAKGGRQYQDPNTTNALLLRKGIDVQQMRGFTIQELCELLGVGYVVQGQVKLQSAGAQVTSSNVSQNKPSGNKPGNNTSTSTTTTSMREEYKTTVEVNLYDKVGKLLYTRDKRSILSSADAYRAAIGYLVKRMPAF